MTDNIRKFLEEASKDSTMQDELRQADNNYFKSVIDIAKGHGITLTHEDIVLLLTTEKNFDGRISNDELGAVAGGKYVDTDDGYLSNCTCAFGGGGTSDGYQKTCACVMGGCGELTDFGKRQVALGHIKTCGSSSGPVAMFCAVLGDGAC